MWKGYYGKEPFDLRLTALRLLRSGGWILAATLAGALLFGGGYYVKNVLLQPEPAYRVTSVYRVEYAVAEEKDVSTVHINEMTWNTYLDTQMFLDEVRRYLPEGGNETDGQLAESIRAVLASNLKVLSTEVTAASETDSLKIAAAVEKALIFDFPQKISEVASISLIDPGTAAQEVYPDVRPLRAFVLSALLSFLAAVTATLLKQLGDDEIWLPSTIRCRYGLNVLGTLESPAFLENLRFLFRECKTAAICPVQERIDPAQVTERLREICQEALAAECQWVAVPSPVGCPECCRELRQADGILVTLAAGSHAGKQLEYVMEYLAQQDCRITAVLLWDADERLLRAYYGFRREKRPGKGEANEDPGAGVCNGSKLK